MSAGGRAIYLGATVSLAILLGVAAPSLRADPAKAQGEPKTVEAVRAQPKVGGGPIHFKVPDAGDVVFSHDRHVGRAKLKCTSCHDGTFVTSARSPAVTMKQMEKRKSCGACHDGKKAFDVTANCSKCHK